MRVTFLVLDSYIRLVISNQHMRINFFERTFYFSLCFLFGFYSFSQCPAGPSLSCDGSGTSLELYWVGTTADGSGNWNEPCSWRVGSVAGFEPCQAPRSIDNVYFEASGFSGSGAPLITLNTQARCDDFVCDSDLDAAAFTIKFQLSNPGFLEVYGDFLLVKNLTWQVVGGNTTGPELFFKSTNSGNKITTSGHEMQAVQFDGIGGEWRLQDDLNCGSFRLVFGEFNTSDGVNDHDINMKTFDSHISTGATHLNRIMKLNSSILTVNGPRSQDRYPYNTTNAPTAEWESRVTVEGTNITFDPGTSKIIFPTNPFVRLGAMNFNVINHTGTGRFYDHFGSDLCKIDTMETSGYLFFHHKHEFNVLKINSEGKQHDFFQDQTINTDFIVSGSTCKPTTLSSEYNRKLTLPNIISSSLNGFLIDNLQCVSPSAKVVTGWGNGNTTGWTINSAISRDLYWVGGTSNNWSEPTNWSTSPTGTTLLVSGDCPPTQGDNVFFISPLADGKICKLNSLSRCNNMTWDIVAPAKSSFIGGQPLYIYGNLKFDQDMIKTTTSNFHLQGTSGNTIETQGIKFSNTLYFNDNSNYTLLDDIEFHSIYFFQHDSFVSGGYNMKGNQLNFRGSGTTDLEGSIVTLTGSAPWYLRGSQSNMIYDANSHVIFTYASDNTVIAGWGAHPHFPNFTLQSDLTKLQFRDHLGNNNNDHLLFDGDVVLNGSVKFYADWGSGTPDGNFEDLVITGDLTLAAGETYEFGLDSKLQVDGDLNAIGPCFSEPITIKHYETTDVEVKGTISMEYVLLQNSKLSSAHTLTNCLDLGGNTNWTFSPPTLLNTYYWRAENGTCPACVYSADWTAPGHWTLNAADTEGSVACSPGPYDKVVFDHKSFDGTSPSEVTIAASAGVHDISSIASDINLKGTEDLIISGSADFDGTVDFSGYTGSITFSSNDVTGETIDFGGNSLASDIIIDNIDGAWELKEELNTSGTFFLNSGSFATQGETISMNSFYSSNSVKRSLSLSNSQVNINGAGNYVTPNNPSNIYSWYSPNVTNFMLDAGTSKIDITSSSEPLVSSGSLDLHRVHFTSTSSAVGTSPVLRIDDWDAEYMKLDCSARIFGSNSFDTLEFTASNVYILESGETNTIKAPNGILLATGSPGQEIAIRSSNTGTTSFIHKANTGGSMTSFCFDYVAIEDNEATSDDPIFTFFTGLNSNDISSSGIWDFTRSVFLTPAIDARADQSLCAGQHMDIRWDIVGSGPYTLTYTVNGNTGGTVTLPNGTSSYTVPDIYHYEDTEYKITSFTADNCGVNTAGTLVDIDQNYLVDDPNVISNNGDKGECTLDNENNFIDIYDDINGRPIVSVKDKSAGTGLGQVEAQIQIDGTTQKMDLGSGVFVPYLQRRFGISTDNDESASVRLYFTKTELDNLSTTWGTTLTLADLRVTKYDNDNMDLTGDVTLIEPIAHGNVPSGITTTANTYYLEVEVDGFSHFFIHPDISAPLPIQLKQFKAYHNGDDVLCKWTVTNEFNVHYFEVMRSFDGVHWESVGQVYSEGNTRSNREYTFVDYNPSNGISYYRLRESDIDGYTEVFDIVPVEYHDGIDYRVYPNPSSGEVTIDLEKMHEEVLITLTNNLGEKEYSQSFYSTEMVKFSFDGDPGVFILTIKTGNETTSLKLFKK